MAIGDTTNNTYRIKHTLAPWFGDLSERPVLNSILTAIGDSYSFCYSYYQFAKLQTRFTTAPGGWLDLFAWDYFGGRFTRRPNELDSSWQPRILQEILRPKQTRAAVVIALEDLTGQVATIVEPWSPQDYGGDGAFKTGKPTVIGGVHYLVNAPPLAGAAICGGYGSGGYGSLSYNNQVFVQAFRPANSGIPNVAGYGIATAWGYGAPPNSGYIGGGGFGTGFYEELASDVSAIPDAEIYATVAQTISAGTTAWVDILGGTPAQPVSANFQNAFNSQYFILGFI